MTEGATSLSHLMVSPDAGKKKGEKPPGGILNKFKVQLPARCRCGYSRQCDIARSLIQRTSLLRPIRIINGFRRAKIAEISYLIYPAAIACKIIINLIHRRAKRITACRRSPTRRC